ncbi:MAG TPA: hypothetical protein VJ123_03635 [Anaerolineales bacterium]|nr:hypothetical protein [Anaerolineales bacterium]
MKPHWNASVVFPLVLIGSFLAGGTIGRGPAAFAASEVALAVAPTALQGKVCSSTAPDCNRSVEDVPAAFRAIIPYNGKELGGYVFGLDGAPDPNLFWHWQTIGRLNHPDGDYIVLTKSEPFQGGRLAVARMDGVQLEADGKWSDADRTPPAGFDPSNTITTVINVGSVGGRLLNHAGGAQVLGNYVVYANECYLNLRCLRTRARLEIWDLATPTSPKLVGVFTPRGGVLGGVATGAALTKLVDGNYLLMGAAHNNADLEFYLAGSLTGPWTVVGAWRKGQHNLPWASFQNMQFVTDSRNGDLYLVGTVGHNPGIPFDDEDWAYLYQASLDGGQIVVEYVDRKRMYCSDGFLTTQYCNFNAGAGIYVTGDGKLALYAVEHNNDGPNGSIKMEQFWPAPAGQALGIQGSDETLAAPPQALLVTPLSGDAVPAQASVLVQLAAAGAPSDAVAQLWVLRGEVLVAEISQYVREGDTFTLAWTVPDEPGAEFVLVGAVQGYLTSEPVNVRVVVGHEPEVLPTEISVEATPEQ